MNAIQLHAILVVGLSALSISCAGNGSWGQRSHCPVVPLSAAIQLDAIELRARMNFRIEDEEARFEVIARGAADDLVVVGITPYGVRLFAVRQRGGEIAVEGALSREFAHLARCTLDALQRSLWIPAPPDVGLAPVINWNWEGENVTESIEGGQRRREFARPSASEPVVIRYLSPSPEAAARVEIQNPWCGYAASFVIIDVPDRVAQ